MLISPYVASPQEVIRRLLELSRLRRGETLYDLGAGEGDPSIIAAEEFGARVVGVELREDLANKATKKVYEAGLASLVTIINQDLFKINLNGADVVYLYLTTSANEKIRPKLENELKKGTRVVSHDYEMVKWKPKKVERFSEDLRLGFPTHTLYLYER